MTGYAGTQRDARQAFVSSYPFEASSGGLGVSLAAISSSATVALVGEGSQMMITNTGSYRAHIRFGDSSVTATTSCLPILPGVYTLTVPEGATYVAAIAPAGDTTIQITRGYGN